MRRARLTHLLSLERLTTVADDFTPAATETWERVAMVRAAIEPTAGKEDRIAEGLQGIVTHRVTFAATPTTTAARPGWRGVRGSRVFHFERVVNEGERNRHMVALAREET